jgi:guanylate kinase
MIKGALFVVTAPSGAGKSTICDAVMKKTDRLTYSISATTRPPRPGEVDGKDYFFLSREEFERGIKENRYLEFARVYDYYYGTPKDFIVERLQAGFDIILDIDVQGALAIKERKYPAVYVYILPPSLQELKNRLEKRGTDSPEVIAKRFAQARREIGFLAEYDYGIINDDLDEAVADLLGVIRAERCRVSRIGEDAFRALEINSIPSRRKQ